MRGEHLVQLERTYHYPEKGATINDWDKHSKYIIKVAAPTDVACAFFDYSQNFNMAAHTIASYLLETERGDISKLDTYFFSLAFLYRHSIELILKAIAFQYIETKTDQASFVKDTFHNLEIILQTIEENFHTSRSDAEMIWLRTYFSDISKIDRESDSFRYPSHIVWKSDDWSISGKFTIKRIFEKQTHIDLIKFANKFEAAYEILEKWYHRDTAPANGYVDLKPIFIEEGGYYYGQSVVGYAYNRDDFFPYTKAYLETANFLRQYMKVHCLSKDEERADNLFMPMCYLYRNCAELSLKTIWFEETGEDFQNRCKMMLDKKHSILGLWNLIKPYAVECGNGDGDEEYIGILENYCKQLHTLDSDASKFRYPVQKDMKPYFNSNRRFDFWTVGKFLEALNNALDSIDSALSVMNEYKAEMEAEYRSEMMGDYDPY